ncbi:hypothetical protein ID866_9228 [Astraeus odoratus]|nr:hypothetical protein ID866_9228 [Astraeus odoratus]
MLTASFRPPSGGWYVRPPPPIQRRGRSRQISAAAKARVASEERRARLLCQLQQSHAHLIPDFSLPPDSLLLQPEMVVSPNDISPPVVPSSSTSSSSSCPIAIHPSTTADPPAAPHRTLSLPPGDSTTGSVSDSLTPASISPDTDDSPLPLPSSLEDQVQVAYALDDIRLAKTLLLKLKGVEVTSDSDPRIDEVRDEDFDMYFVPSGPLTLEPADKRAVEETQRKQQEGWQKSQRAMRLRACEKLWEDEKRRLHQEKLAAARRREEAERRRAVQRQLREHDQREHQQRSSRVRYPERSLYLRPLTTLQVRQEKCPVSLPRREEEPFQYSFMVPSKPTKAALTRQCLRSPKAAGMQAAVRAPASPDNTVCFKEVIKSMNGKLFPLDVSEQVEDARRIAGLDSFSTTRHRRRASARAELLDQLLEAVECSGDKRNTPCGDAPRGTVHLPQSAPIPAAQSSDSVTSMSSPLSSRSNSWFSFGSWRSSCTDITVPDSQIATTPECSAPVLLPSVQECQQDHHCPRCSFVRISLEESPLTLPVPPQHERRHYGDISISIDKVECSSDCARKTLLQRVSRSVSGIVEAARGIQSAYISAALLTAGIGPSYVTCPQVHQRRPSRCRQPARPEGFRVCARDVKKFTASDSLTTPPSAEAVLFIPLVSFAPMPPSTSGLPPHRLTTTDALIVPSPLRPRTPPTVLAYRMRPVANPALLRLRALQNLMCARGKEWEGRAREGGLGCGKERMLGIAFEGRGRSGLGCEVRFAVA